MNYIDKVIKDFDSKCFELKADINYNVEGETKTHEFGYRLMVAERVNEVFTITDWGNIKKFIRQALEKQREEYEKELEARALRASEHLVGALEKQREEYEVLLKISEDACEVNGKTINSLRDKLNKQREEFVKELESLYKLFKERSSKRNCLYCRFYLWY
jgi:hypothetical protein